MMCFLPAALCVIVQSSLEWCPDPQRPDAQWIKIFHPGAWTPQDERDDPPPRHTYREWKEFYDQVHVHVPSTNGSEPDNYFTSMFSLINTAWPHSHRLCASTQMLEAILRSSDASAFSTEDLIRLQAGICQQPAGRTRQASRPHQPVRTSRGADPPESTGVADPYLPASRPNSSDVKEKPIFELVAEQTDEFQ